MKKKIVAIIAICALLACLASMAACELGTGEVFNSFISTDVADNEAEENYYLTDDPMYNQDVLTMSKVTLSKNIDRDYFGLFIFDPVTYRFVHAEDETTQFDNNKPIVIFTHGMGSGGIPGDDELIMYAAGYNVLVFKWGDYAEGGPGDTVNLTSKLWGVNDEYMCYFDETKNEYVYHDNPSHGMAWQYVSYFNDFMKAHPDFNGSEIHLYGHSFGGMLTLATLGCMMWGVRTNNFSREYLPDRVVMCDPYVTIVDNSTICDWTGKPLTNGSIGIGTQILEDAHAEGIPVAIIRSSPWVLMLGTFWGSSDKATDEARFAEMYPLYTEKSLHIDYDTEFLETQLGMIDGINERHCISVEYYEQGFGLDYVYDSSDPTGKAYGFAYNMPLTYFFARVGATYNQVFGAGEDLDITEYDRSDDVQTSTNITNAKIAGFAFYDKNDNGINDDRVYNRVSGVTATLYKNGEKVSTMTTARNGYYEFVIDDITAKYTVEVSAPDGYTISTKTDSSENPMDVNAFSKGATSAEITFGGIYDIAVLNVGLKK